MRAVPVTCSKCGQTSDVPPGFKLDEFELLSAVFVRTADGNDFDSAPTPQRLTCQRCGHAVAVVRDSIEVRTA